MSGESVPLKKRPVDNLGYYVEEKPPNKKKREEDNVICIDTDDDDESSFSSSPSMSTNGNSSPEGLMNLGKFGLSDMGPPTQGIEDSPGLNTQPSPAFNGNHTSTSTEMSKNIMLSPSRVLTKHSDSVTNSKKTTSNRVSMSPKDSLAKLGETTTAKDSAQPPAKESNFRLTKQNTATNSKKAVETKETSSKTEATTQKKRKKTERTKATRVKKKSTLDSPQEDWSFLDDEPRQPRLSECIKQLSDNEEDSWIDDNPMPLIVQSSKDKKTTKPVTKESSTNEEKLHTLGTAVNESETKSKKATKNGSEATKNSEEPKKGTSDVPASKNTTSPEKIAPKSEKSNKLAKEAKPKAKKSADAKSKKAAKVESSKMKDKPKEASKKPDAKKSNEKSATSIKNQGTKVLEVEVAETKEMLKSNSAPQMETKSSTQSKDVETKSGSTSVKAKATPATKPKVKKVNEQKVSTTKVVKNDDITAKVASKMDQVSDPAVFNLEEKSTHDEAKKKTSNPSSKKADKSKSKAAAPSKNPSAATDGSQTAKSTVSSASSASLANESNISSAAAKETTTNDKKKEKLKAAKAKVAGTQVKKKKATFQDQVLRQMVFAGKPYSSASLAKELKVTEQQLKFTILSLLDKGLVIQKDFTNSKGKTKTLIWANLESKAKEAVPLDFSPTKYMEAHQELSLLSKREKELQQELAKVISLPCNKELSTQIELEEEAVAQLKKRLEDTHTRIKEAKEKVHQPKPGIGRFQPKPKSEAQLAREQCPRRLKMRINAMRGEWKTRKTKCKDFVDTLADAMEKKPKEILKLLDVEADEEAGVTMPPKYQID